MFGRQHSHQPGNSSEIVVEEYLLRRAAMDRDRSERQVAEAVSEAVSRGMSWERISRLLELSDGEARTRYGTFDIPRAS